MSTSTDSQTLTQTSLTLVPPQISPAAQQEQSVFLNCMTSFEINDVIREFPCLLLGSFKNVYIKGCCKFGQKSVDSKDFYRSKRIIDVSNIDLNKIVVSNSISCNKGKDQRFVVGYEDDEKIIALYIKDSSKSV